MPAAIASELIAALALVAVEDDVVELPMNCGLWFIEQPQLLLLELLRVDATIQLQLLRRRDVHGEVNHGGHYCSIHLKHVAFTLI